MEVGETLEVIRKSKNISICEMCGSFISRQTYFRIIHESVDTSLSKFMYLLSQLNVTYDEFLFIKNDFSIDTTYQIIENARYLFENQNEKELDKLKNLCVTKEFHTLREKHLFHLISIYHCFLTKKDYSTHKNIIQNYLINIETWTHYELVLFNNSMFIFDSEIIELLANKCTNRLQKYTALRVYGNEGFRLNLNIVLFYLNQNKQLDALDAIERLPLIILKEDDLYERLSFKFFMGIKSIIIGDKSGYDTCNQVIEILEFLDSESTYLMFKYYLQKLKETYDNENEVTLKI